MPPHDSTTAGRKEAPHIDRTFDSGSDDKEEIVKKAAVAVFASMLALSLTSGGTAHAMCPVHRSPVVSNAWLESHLDSPDVVVVDVRTADEYQAGHIRNAVNSPFEVPFSAWVTMRDDLLLELPDASDLFEVLGGLGITKHSRVVIVTSNGDPPYPLANATRVAVTMAYAGVPSVSILDGGYPQWVAEGRVTTTAVPTIDPSTYRGSVDDDLVVDTDYVATSIGRSLIVDARDANVYSGEVVEPWAEKAGHIPSALSLPATSIWNGDGTYKSRSELEAIAEQVVGERSSDREIIVYCGVGGYASSWLFVLSDILGYRDVKLYDGSAQEWVRYHDMEV